MEMLFCCFADASEGGEGEYWKVYARKLGSLKPPCTWLWAGGVALSAKDATSAATSVNPHELRFFPSRRHFPQPLCVTTQTKKAVEPLALEKLARISQRK